MSQIEEYKRDNPTCSLQIGWTMPDTPQGTRYYRTYHKVGQTFLRTKLTTKKKQRLFMGLPQEATISFCTVDPRFMYPDAEPETK